jgi:thiosulfate reductase cytochrome b subunit
VRRRITEFLAAALVCTAATAAHAQEEVNPIHPLFAPLDAAGQKTRSAADVSLERTCGACHDASWIGEHSSHSRVRATCADCHLAGGTLAFRPEALDAHGQLPREAIRIATPGSIRCAGCHGLVTPARTPVALPPDFAITDPERRLSLTLGQGAIVSPQRMSDSFLNLEGKDTRATPWDVHAARLVDCAACHRAGNDPAQRDARRRSLSYLTADPRRPSTAEFLARPDHRLAAVDCRGCHDARSSHAFLPYRERHLAVLSCATCHVSTIAAPAAEMVDATVVTLDGAPLVRFRNVDLRAGEAGNAALIRPLVPLLVERVEADGARRLAPVNPVSRFRWVSGAGRAAVAPGTVARAFLDGGGYARPVMEAFDSDRDGRLDERELRLDRQDKVALIAERLSALGVAQPVIEGTLETYALAHGVSSRGHALRECAACHAANSRVAQSYSLASYLPGGVVPRPADGERVELAGVVARTRDGGLMLRPEREAAPGGLHVLGLSREAITNLIGFALFAIVSLALAAHGIARVALRRRRRAPAAPVRIRVFGAYERVWHWIMAVSVLLLVATGLVIHGGADRGPLGLATAVSLHNAFAVVLMGNAFLALLYHLATRAIRHFIPEPRGFVARALAHMGYQARGIFAGRPHPPNAPGQKLNPLQQVTYLALLNILFPLQIGTGILIWAVGHWPEVAPAVGGLRLVAPAHNLGAWLLLTFTVLHVYLVTTGRTPTEHVKAMLTGYRDVEAGEPTPQETP